MRILHTSDLHLGRSLYGASRDETFEKLVDWLTSVVKAESVDCLLIAGDVFDNTTPSHRMQRAYYRLLAAVCAADSCRHVVVVGGNHDSATLLNAPQALLEALNITVVGSARENPADEAVRICDSAGAPCAVIAAVPYLRERDLRSSVENETQQDKESAIEKATAAHYRAVIDAALSLRGERDVPIIATGHLFAACCSASSAERSLYIGSLGAVSAESFPAEIDYLALGHLHRPQCVAGCETRRYSGSPLALDFPERHEQKSVCIIETQGRACSVRTLPVPAFDTLVQITGDREKVLKELRELADRGEPVFCEVQHTEGVFAPDLANRCREIVRDGCVTLVRVVSRTVAAAMLNAGDVTDNIESVTPEKMFELRLTKEAAASTLSPNLQQQLVEAHAEILENVRRGENQA